MPPSPDPSPAPLRLRLLGQGPFTDALEQVLSRQPFVAALERRSWDDDPTADGDHPPHLVVAIGEDCSRGNVRRCQERCLAAQLPSLYFSLEADSIRLGPLNLVGLAPCWACAQRPPQGDASDGRFIGAKELPGTPLDRAARHLIAALGHFADPARRPPLLGRVRHFDLGGGDFELAVDRQPECPLCCAQAADDDSPWQPRISSALLQGLEERPTLSCTEEPQIRRVAVLGGGTAGYLTALALRRHLPHLDVTLIESSRHPVIGVGEATTPLMPQFLHADLALDIDDFFATVQPTLKLGIDFHWGPQASHHFSYPFGPLRPLEALTYDGHLRHASLRAMAMVAGKVSLLQDGPHLPHLGAEVAYHLDNRRLVRFLERQARQRGVEPIDAEIVDTEVHGSVEAGRWVGALRSADGRRFEHDLYIDCSGFRAALIGDAMASPWISFDGSLFTDRAWVTQRRHDGRHVPPFTRATAMPHGWCWNTPQRQADHLGYVFASAFVEPQAAADELLRHVPDAAPPRLVRFVSGRRRDMRRGNVIALGNAYGFVEPLESTALHLLLRQLGWLIGSFPRRRFEPALEAALNRRSAEAWDYVRWFLALHFRFQRHLDSPFWRACRELADVSLHRELIDHFQSHGPLSYDPHLTAAAPSADPLWGLTGIDQLLLGQGVPCPMPTPTVRPERWQAQVAACERVLASSPSHAEALERLATSPELRRALVRSFVDRGPAMGPRRQPAAMGVG